MEKKRENKWKWKVIAGILLLAIAFFVYFGKGVPEAGSEIEILDIPTAGETVEENPPEEGVAEPEPEFILVDIGGAVLFPGVLELPEGSRVIDAVEAAGGLLPEAETKNVNLAAFLLDGEKIYIPTEQEEKAGISGSSTPVKININTADSAALQTLKGVGEATAAAIIEYRKTNGGFQKTEDLMKVSGIGEKTYEKLKDYIRVK